MKANAMVHGSSLLKKPGEGPVEIDGTIKIHDENDNKELLNEDS